jgi:hypothetical protein
MQRGIAASPAMLSGFVAAALRNHDIDVTLAPMLNHAPTCRDSARTRVSIEALRC